MPRTHSPLWRLAALALVIGLIPTLLSAQKKESEWSGQSAKAVEIAGAKRMGSETCAACHSETADNFRHAFHAQQGIECEDCHGSGSLHIEGGGDVKKIFGFEKRSPRESNAVCLSCHARDHEVQNWVAGAHSVNHVRCTDCHQVHAKALKAANESRFNFDPTTRGALTAELVSPETSVVLRPRSATNDACLKCHLTQVAQLSMPYHHPLREAKMSCDDCHNPHGGPTGNNLRVANVNQLCLTCHAQYRGPFAYQHPPVSENCMLCHTAHGSPNTSLLQVSEPALCLQCHVGHHDGASLPLTDRCTNCHISIHGTDTPTPSGGSRFIDKGPSDPALIAAANPAAALRSAHAAVPAHSLMNSVHSLAPSQAVGASSALTGMMSSGGMPPLSGGSDSAEAEAGAADSAFSFTPGTYRFVDGSGFLGRVGEYDSLEQSGGTEATSAYVSTRNHFTAVSQAYVLTGDDYGASSQVTWGEWLQAAFNTRGFVQQQDNYPFYAFPVLDIPPGTTTPTDTTTNSIPAGSVFGVRRRLGDAHARFKLPKLPVHLFVNGDWQARSGLTQLAYLDENTLPITAATPCGALCHFNSQFQSVNYTTRGIGGGADVDLGPVRLTYEHKYSSFNDRLVFPTATFTGPFDPQFEGISINNPPPSGPTPMLVPAGNYPLDIPAPNQSSTDSLNLNWVASPTVNFNGNVSYARLRDVFTRNPQNAFGADASVNWRVLDHLLVTATYHQQNVLNDFTPYYSLFGDVSYHNHSEGLRLDYELPKGFDVEAYYRREGITRSDAALWPQIYSIDNTDLQYVVPSSFSNTTGLALRYHDRSTWSTRLGYEWTGTHDPGYLLVPKTNNRVFADAWYTPTPKLVFANDLNIIVQNNFAPAALPNTPTEAPGFGGDISGLPPDFQRRDRFYFETLTATLRPVPGWSLGLGYSYQQNNLNTYMAFQNDSGPGYVIDEPHVPYKQVVQAYWGETNYTMKQRLGLSLRVTYNSSRSGMRPDVNPADAPLLGNQALISQGIFDPNGLFASALNNVQIASTQISQVIVPQWIGMSKVYYRFPYKLEGGLIFYYGSYRDYWNNGRAVGPNMFAPNLNGVLRTFNVYVGRSW
jgi:predicted CXXCH cytochrome family protein